MENSIEKNSDMSEELEPWDAEFHVEDDDASAASGSKAEKQETSKKDETSVNELLNDTDPNTENTPVDSPDIAVTRSPKPKKPKKDKKKKNAKKKDNVENLNGELEKMEVGDESVQEEADEELEKDIQLTAADADGPTRNSLFEKGLQLMRKKKKDLALKCYLRCLNGLRDDTGFTYVPQCLHNIADIYYEKEEFDKAVQFIQAEKMYYETALIDTSELQKKFEERQKEIQGEEEEDQSDDPLASKPEAMRATEYAHLAQLCLDKDQPQLALEYCGKATKLRQQVYGENHPISLKTLDFFTIVYAEAGKQQYSESMKKFTEEDLVNLTDLRLGGDVNVLKNRKKQANANKSAAKAEDKKVRFEEEPTHTKADEEQMSRTLLWIFFSISTAILAVLGIYLYCRMNNRSPSCRNFVANLSYVFMRMKYYYYYYTTTSASDTYI